MGFSLNYQVKKQLKNDGLYRQMREALAEMEAQLKTLCRSEQIEMAQNLERVVMAGGKRLRPTLAWICHRIGRDTEENAANGRGRKLEILPLMCMVELMHTASLIHDDVVDDAPLRRGVATIHETSGRLCAVQSGDFLLGRAMEYLHIYRGTGINEALADISTQMCLGEFQQMESLFDTGKQNRDTYYEQIRRKTAYLIATSCYCGGIAGGLSPEQCQALKKYGEQIGIAFQLKDDILDFTGTDVFGKPLGQDLRRGIFTLPILYSFDTNPDKKMEQLAAKQKKNQEEVDTLVNYVSESRGIEHTEFQIRVCSHEAIRALEILPECSEKDALIQMAQTLRKRKL
ncbi:MAG: polyprenyl synthetase family protein [Eubacterium sp.]